MCVNWWGTMPTSSRVDWSDLCSTSRARAAWSRSRGDLIAVEARGVVRIVDVQTKQCVRAFQADFYRMVASGASIITCSNGRGAQVLLRSWDWSTGLCTLGQRLQNVTPGRTCFELRALPNNRVAVSNYFEVRVCDSATLTELYVIRRPGVQSVLGLPDGGLILCVDHTWLKYQGAMLVREGVRHGQSVTVYQLLGLGDDLFASCGNDGMIRLWDMETQLFVRYLEACVLPSGVALLSEGYLASICSFNPSCISLTHYQQGFRGRRLYGPSMLCGLLALRDGRLLSEHENGDVCLWV